MTISLREIRKRCENPSAEFLEKVTNFSGYTYTGLEFIDPFELSKSFANEFNLPALLDWVEGARFVLEAIDKFCECGGPRCPRCQAQQLLSEIEP